MPFCGRYLYNCRHHWGCLNANLSQVCAHLRDDSSIRTWLTKRSPRTKQLVKSFTLLQRSRIVIWYQVVISLRRPWSANLPRNRSLADLTAWYPKNSRYCTTVKCISIRLSALLQLHLRFRLNTWLQWIGQRQLQDDTRNIKVLGIGAPYIRDLTVRIAAWAINLLHPLRVAWNPLQSLSVCCCGINVKTNEAFWNINPLSVKSVWFTASKEAYNRVPVFDLQLPWISKIFAVYCAQSGFGSDLFCLHSIEIPHWTMGSRVNNPDPATAKKVLLNYFAISWYSRYFLTMET